MNKLTYILLIFLFLPYQSYSQNDTIKYDVGLLGVASHGVYSPFWLQSKQYGKISEAPYSADIFVGINKELNKETQLFDYGFKANLLVRTDAKMSTIYFHEMYAKARLSVFDIIIGSREEHLGNQDSTLSCGGILFSQNARPMPKITFGIEHFTTVPFTKGYLELKGALVHGWFTDNTYVKNAWLLHNYVYGRLGGRLPVHFEYGLDHVAQWGGYSPEYGQQPVSFQDYKKIFYGRSGGTDASIGDQINALGNHIISQSMKLEVKLFDYRISGYWQNISEDGPIRIIWDTMNRPDGLWGVTLRNNKFPFVKGILYEYLNTTDQSGPYHDKDGIIYGGADCYFTNGSYPSGWSYYSRTIGTPFISSPSYNTDGTLETKNNRVQVHHFGIEGDVYDYQYRFLTSYSKNYGTYAVPLSVEKKKSASVMLEVKKQFPTLSNVEIGCSVAADYGKFYGNSIGGMFSIRKTGDLFHY